MGHIHYPSVALFTVPVIIMLVMLASQNQAIRQCVATLCGLPLMLARATLSPVLNFAMMLLALIIFPWHK